MSDGVLLIRHTPMQEPMIPYKKIWRNKVIFNKIHHDATSKNLQLLSAD